MVLACPPSRYRGLLGSHTPFFFCFATLSGRTYDTTAVMTTMGLTFMSLVRAASEVV
jgi:hypothetical protein